MFRQLALIFLLFPIFSSAQNIVVNGGFEDENTCTEYSATCSPEAWISTGKALQNYIKSYSRAHNGQHCYAIESGHSRLPYLRSFVRSRLLCGLRAGNKYRFTMYLKSPHPIIDSIGVYFTAEDIFYEKKKLKDIQPAFYLSPANIFDKKDTSWQKAEVVYTARGNETFITIGNFCKRDISGPTGIPMMNQFLVYIDDLSLTPLDEKEMLCTDWLKRKEEIYDQNERHQFMERLIRMQRYNRIPGEKLSTRTSIVMVDTLTLPDILFETGKAVLQPGSLRLLDSLCLRSRGRTIDSLVVKGHTDNTGTEAKNERLSLDRANAVADYMAAKINDPAISFRTYGLGDRFPVADNQLSQGRQRNRRVEILLYIRD